MTGPTHDENAPLDGFSIPSYPLVDEDGAPITKVETIYPPPYGFDRDRDGAFHFIYGRNAERAPWVEASTLLFDAPVLPTQVLTQFFVRAITAERRVEQLERQLSDMRRSVVSKTKEGSANADLAHGGGS